MTRNPPPIDLRAAPAIEVLGAHKHYGAHHAVDGIDLRVARGEILGLIGHNGAGKSTLFKMILGLTPTTSGEIRVGGTSVSGRDFRTARRHLGYLPENVVLYDNLSGLETLRFFARLKAAPLAQCAALLDQVGLAHAGSRPVREYSKGMRQRLGFAQALLGSPQVLLLDEPTNGLDPQAIRDFYATLRRLQAQGVTIVITSHILAELQERVDRLAILASGRLQALGSVQALRERTHMPLAIDLVLAPADVPAALQAVARLPGITPLPTPEGLRLTCPRELKVATLAALAPLGTRLADVQIHEPSLEDVYFGLREL